MDAQHLVSITRVRDYDRATVEQRMRDCLAPLGGMKAFVRPGQRVLLKPNLLSNAPPEKAVTTHPAVVAAAITLVKEAGGVPLVGDSPGIGALENVAGATGIRKVVQEHGAALADFSHEHAFECPDNAVGKRLNLARAVVDADVIITLPKLKTHVQMVFTCAVKNQYGLIPGLAKGQYHFRLRDRDKLADLIIDVNRVAKPALGIVDAIDAMEGEGPGSGEPRRLGLLLAGADLMALDVVACHIINLDPDSVPTIRAGKRQGYGTTSLGEIEIVGESIEDVRVKDFKQVKHLLNVMRILPLPQFMLKWFSTQWAPRPFIISDKCIHCNACAKGCPVSPPAIDPEMPPGRQVNVRTCIRCYCCHEFCPAKAIGLKRSLLDRTVHLTKTLNNLARRFPGARRS